MLAVLGQLTYMDTQGIITQFIFGDMANFNQILNHVLGIIS